jgi:hypothetical protein
VGVVEAIAGADTDRSARPTRDVMVDRVEIERAPA